MLNFHVVTLFPDIIQDYCSASIVGRGIKAEKIKVDTYNPRDFVKDNYKKVDDTPYGGGAGMVLLPEPFFAAFESIPRDTSTPVLLMSPQGQPFKQEFAETLSTFKEITLLCGHYEGFDERIRTLATHEVSIGDFVMTGGELPANAVIDAVSRLVPGVIGKSISLANESFVESLLEGPQYTKPAVFRGMEVPEILRSGNHQLVNKWRRQQALKRTFERRPDLLDGANLSKDDLAYIATLGQRE